MTLLSVDAAAGRVVTRQKKRRKLRIRRKGFISLLQGKEGTAGG
jgi:hypothetical protein